MQDNFVGKTSFSTGQFTADDCQALGDIEAQKILLRNLIILNNCALKLTVSCTYKNAPEIIFKSKNNENVCKDMFDT